jgi:hypothetical protein
MKKIFHILIALIVFISCVNAQTKKVVNIKPKVDNIQKYKDSIIALAKLGYAKYHKDLSTRRVIIVDFSRPMEQERLFVVDLDSNKIIKSTKVCHGKGSGMISIPTVFSNTIDSKQSSLGFMKTAETYKGLFGYSMKVDGLEKRNNNTRKRAIIFHNSEVQSTPWSWGCFSIPERDCKEVIELTKKGSLIYAFSNL